MNKKIITKAVAMLLVFVIAFANVATLGSYAVIYASSETSLEEQSTQISKTKIEFDAYFIEGGNKVHSRTIGVDEEDAKIYLSLKV